MSTKWLVQTDNITDDPTVTLRDTSGGVPTAKTHPWDGAQVPSSYTVSLRLTHKAYHVIVRYDYPLVFNLPGNENKGWRFNLSNSLETENILVDINGKPVGPGAYTPVKIDEDTGAADVDQQIRLREQFPGIDLTKLYTARRQINAEGFLTIFQLYKLPGEQRVQPITRTKPVSTLTISRTFPSMSIPEIAVIESGNNAVNFNTFFGAQRGNLKLTGSNISDRPGTLSGQANAGTIYDVSITFQHDAQGHTPVEQVDTFLDNFGNESAIKLIGEVQSSESDVYFERRFTFAADGKFISGRPITKGPGRGRP